MTFDEILEGATEMLRRRGKVSRRALARQFELDDGYLDDIVEEIVAVQELARQEDGGVLVWLGPDSAAAAERVEVTDASSDAAVLPAPSVQNHGERRQLTVVFCDLVQFTQLSGVVDAEELRELVRAYQKTCEEVVASFDGTVAQFLGDGVLVYFGYPRAHEDEAIRAVRAALAIIDEMGRLNARLQEEYDVRLRVRIGVHTGLVVIGEMGSEGRKEEMALGEAPNAAARLQGLAEPDTVVVSSATLSLTNSEFETVDLGEHVLKGITAPFHVHRVVGHADSGRREAPRRTPLVGRGPELALLDDRWTLARQGHGQAVLISGEAGIGKSRLCAALRDRVPQEGARSLTFRCDRHASNSSLAPIIAHLQRVLALGRGESRDGALQRIESFVLRAGG
ncbi:MAG: adenylate/guanylate cyclase domain-containing protein, partial [Longimicrobiaceae bacterium]